MHAKLWPEGEVQRHRYAAGRVEAEAEARHEHAEGDLDLHQGKVLSDTAAGTPVVAE